MCLWATIALLLIVGLWSTRGLDKVRLDDDGHFVDSHNRRMLFRGFNSVQKCPPWYPPEMLNKTQLRMFQQWGLNVVRLGVMWAGVMPEKLVVDQKYMSTIEAIVDACAEHDIYVLLDMHQDALSTQFGAYDGLPLWFVNEVCNTPVSFAYPWPYDKPPENWFENYITYACMDCATKLYKNESGAWIYWAEFWREVAERFGNKENVIGYELINEPPPPNVYEDLLSVIPGVAGRRYLLPVYDYLVEQIRKIDKNTLIFYEPLTYGVFFPDTKLETGTGFSRVPGLLTDPDAKKTSVLSYHYYCWPIQTADPSRNMSTELKIICDLLLLPSVFINSQAAVKQTGGGRFLTEFGVCAPDGNPFSINTIECNAVLNMADTTLQSWAYWDGNFLDKQGNPILHQIYAFIRPYPHWTLGVPRGLQFDVLTGKFYYSFMFRGLSTSEDITVCRIFVPISIHYADGLEIRVQPAFVNHTLTDNYLHLTVPEGLSGQTFSIIVRLARATKHN